MQTKKILVLSLMLISILAFACSTNGNTVDGDTVDGDTVDGDTVECPAENCLIDSKCIEANTINAEYICAVCDPQNDRFTWSARSDDTICRAAGLCDIAETCDGLSFSCPVDQVAGSGIACDDSADCTSNDVCDGLGLGLEHQYG